MARRGVKKEPFPVRPFKFMVAAIFLIFSVFLLCSGVSGLIRNAEIFRIKEIVKGPALSFVESRYLDRLKGRSLFSADLKSLQAQLQSRYPHIDRLRIVREFPNRLYLTARHREPYAWIMFPGRRIFLDREGIVLPSEETVPGLPEIQGIENNRKVSLGQPLESARVPVVFNIIEEIRKNRYLDGYLVKTVNIQHLSKIEVFLEGSSPSRNGHSLYVLMDRDQVRNKVQKLGILLSQGNLPPDGIKYIDLRFKEPILSKQ